MPGTHPHATRTDPTRFSPRNLQVARTRTREQCQKHHSMGLPERAHGIPGRMVCHCSAPRAEESRRGPETQEVRMLENAHARPRGIRAKARDVGEGVRGCGTHPRSIPMAPVNSVSGTSPGLNGAVSGDCRDAEFQAGHAKATENIGREHSHGRQSSRKRSH